MLCGLIDQLFEDIRAQLKVLFSRQLELLPALNPWV